MLADDRTTSGDVPQPSGIRELRQSERKRLYSWSRPTREMRNRGVKCSMLYSEHCISGEATIVVHKSGDWFQGNIISITQDAYTVHGKREQPIRFSPAPIRKNVTSLPCDLGSATDCSLGVRTSSSSLASSAHSPSPSNSSGTSASTPPVSSSPLEGSTCDSLDSELVLKTMERLDLEMAEDGLFKLTVVDFETGLNHNINGVTCSISSDSMYLEGDQVSFVSDQCLKGTKADKTILTCIGPSLVGSDVIVYKGRMSLTYRDEPCYPVTLEGSQWCM